MMYENEQQAMFQEEETYKDGAEQLGIDEDDDYDELAFLEYDDDDDDEEFGAMDDYDDDDDEEFLGSLLPGIAAGTKAIGGLFSKRKRRRVRIRRPRRHNVFGSKARVSIPTRKGNLRAYLGKRYVTPAELKKALSGVRKDILQTKSEIKRVESNSRKDVNSLRKSTASALSSHVRYQRRLDIKQNSKIKKLETDLTKKVNDSKQMMMMMTLMQDTPEVESLQLKEGIKPNDQVLNVSETNYADSENSLMLPLLLMGDSFGSDNNGLLLALALSGSL